MSHAFYTFCTIHTKYRKNFVSKWRNGPGAITMNILSRNVCHLDQSSELREVSALNGYQQNIVFSFLKMQFVLKHFFYTERTILLKCLKIQLDTDLKIILLDYQKNYVEYSSIMRNAVTNFDILATTLNVLHSYFRSISS